MLFRVFETGPLIALALGFLSSIGQQPGKVGAMGLKVGDTAPDFSLKDQNNKSVKLADFRGKSTVILAFFPLAFTGG